MECPLPAGLPDSSAIRKILDSLAHQADIAFNMMVGLGEAHLEIQSIPSGYLGRTWDYTGVVSTEGDLIVTLGCGLSRGEAHYLSAHMLGQEIEDQTLVLGCLQELLNVVLGGAIGPISEVFPVRMGLPRMGQNGLMATGHGADAAGMEACTSVLLHLACSDVHLDLVVVIEGGRTSV